MTLALNNEFFHFEWLAGQAAWQLAPAGADGLALHSLRMRVEYHLDGRLHKMLLDAQKGAFQPLRIGNSPLGELELLEVELPGEPSPLQVSLSFALAKSTPLFLWKIKLKNSAHRPLSIQRITLLELGGAGEPFPALVEPAFYANGWQTWSFSGAYGAQDYPRRSHLGFFDMPMRLNAGSPAPRRRGHFAAEMFGVLGDRTTRKAALLGFLSQHNHFGSLEADLRSAKKKLRLWANGDDTRLDAGTGMETDWACIQWVDPDATDPLAPYLEAAARQNGIAPGHFQDEVPGGWCSWYQYYKHVRAQDIRRNLDTAAAMRSTLPLQVIQIDDGFEQHAGDWQDFTAGFSQGVAPLAAEIRSAGFTPGLWLAPFLLERRSRLAHEHPDWLLRGRFNLPANAGFLWGGFTTALDLSCPPALQHACDVVRTAVHEWGFPYLKLDFLYAGALPGRRADRGRTRAQILRAALQALRAAAGEQAFLLGCGCPLGSALGLVDGMRIGADVDARWTPLMLGRDIPFLRGEPDQPGARNAIQNTLTRAFLHRRWWYNDPDCLLLRQETALTLAETQTLATVIALSGGMLLLSDDLAALPPERLVLAQALLPVIGKSPQVLDWFDALTPRRLRLDLGEGEQQWSLLALFNWQDAPQEVDFCLRDFALDQDGEYWLREFWHGEVLRLSGGQKHSLLLPAHGVYCCAARRATSSAEPSTIRRQGELSASKAEPSTTWQEGARLGGAAPIYLGGSLHISQGQEVERFCWQPEQALLQVALRRPGVAGGEVDIFLPQPPLAAHLDGQELSWSALGQGVYRFAVGFDTRAMLRIHCAQGG